MQLLRGSPAAQIPGRALTDLQQRSLDIALSKLSAGHHNCRLETDIDRYMQRGPEDGSTIRVPRLCTSEEKASQRLSISSFDVLYSDIFLAKYLLDGEDWDLLDADLDQQDEPEPEPEAELAASRRHALVPSESAPQSRSSISSRQSSSSSHRSVASQRDKTEPRLDPKEMYRLLQATERYDSLPKAVREEIEDRDIEWYELQIRITPKSAVPKKRKAQKDGNSALICE